jgi:hypothetical protein
MAMAATAAAGKTGAVGSAPRGNWRPESCGRGQCGRSRHRHAAGPSEVRKEWAVMPTPCSEGV